MREYRTLSKRDRDLPPADGVLRVYGSWTAARTAVMATQRVPNLRTVHRAYIAGATPHELAERIGISHTTIVTAFREAGLPVRGYSETRSKRTELADRVVRAEVIKTFRRGQAPTGGVRGVVSRSSPRINPS